MITNHISHEDLTDLRRKIRKLQDARDEAMAKEIIVRSCLSGLAKKYEVEGLRHQINPDTGEIQVYPEKVHYEGWQGAFHAEKVAEGRNIWTEELAEEMPVEAKA